MTILDLVNDIRVQLGTEKAIPYAEVIQSINRVLKRINIVFKGVETIETLETNPENYSSGDMSTFQYLTFDINIPDTISKVQKVYVNDNVYANIDRETFLESTATDICCIVGKTIYFKYDLSDYATWFATGSSDYATLKLVGFKVLTTIALVDTTNTELPTASYEVLFQGAVFNLASKPEYYNKVLYEDSKMNYYNLLEGFGYLMESREPRKQITQEYTW